MLTEIMKYNNFYKQVQVNFSNKKEPFHAYIIETNDCNDYESVVLELVKYIIYNSNSDNSESSYQKISTLIDQDNFPDFQKVYPQNQIIKKEQLISVKDKFKTKAIDNKQVYVIFEADKMNNHAANTILKFLEEPSEGIIALLVVKNRYMLLDTIISRCQVLTIDNNNFTVSEDIENLLVQFFDLFSSSKNAYLNYNKILNELFIDKKQTIQILDLLQKKYYNYIYDKNQLEEDVVKDNIKNLETNKILAFIEVINTEKAKLKYNVNFKLWLDQFIIKYMEVKENV